LPDSRHLLAFKDDSLWLFDSEEFAAPVLIAGPLSATGDAHDFETPTPYYFGHTAVGLLAAIG
jgi:hypothetical protein